MDTSSNKIFSKSESLPMQTLIQTPTQSNIHQPLQIFAEQKTINEYNKDKVDYTQKALKELQEQMKNFDFNKKPNVDKVFNSNKFLQTTKSSSNNVSNNVLEISDNEQDSETEIDLQNNKQNINLIIKHVLDKKKANNSNNSNNSNNNIKSKSMSNVKIADESITNVIYAQHELDIKTISKLNKTITELQSNIKDLKKESDDVESKLYYLKLDLGNAQCDKFELEKQVICLKEDLEKTKIKHTYAEEKNKIFQVNIKYINIFIVILLMLNIYFEDFKYLLIALSIIGLFMSKIC